MAYYSDLFTVDTYEHFLKSDRSVSGFRQTQETTARRIKPGDTLLAYITGLSRWAAALEVLDGPFEGASPLFVPDNDPFVVRFRVRPCPALTLEHAVPIREPEVFENLSFTRGNEGGYWLGPLRRSLAHIDDNDGRLIQDLLERQDRDRRTFPLDPADIDKHRTRRVKRADGEVSVRVPRDEIDAEPHASPKSDRDSIKYQAAVCKLGEMMGFRIWLPRNDRAAVRQHWEPDHGSLLESLPLNYDDTTPATIEQIDVLWLKGRAIQRAFEVEHSTAIYSGLLRMADPLALQPNMDILLHIVAPADRRGKVLNEIRRPVFSLLEHRPLAERCTFIAYEALQNIMRLEHLMHLSDSVLEEYEETAQE